MSLRTDWRRYACIAPTCSRGSNRSRCISMLAIACCTSTEVSADSRATGGSLPCVQRINGGRQRSSTAPSAFQSPPLGSVNQNRPSARRSAGPTRRRACRPARRCGRADSRSWQRLAPRSADTTTGFPWPRAQELDHMHRIDDVLAPQDVDGSRLDRAARVALSHLTASIAAAVQADGGPSAGHRGGVAPASAAPARRPCDPGPARRPRAPAPRRRTPTPRARFQWWPRPLPV